VTTVDGSTIGVLEFGGVPSTIVPEQPQGGRHPRRARRLRRGWIEPQIRPSLRMLDLARTGRADSRSQRLAQAISRRRQSKFVADDLPVLSR
jgi:hypothetical protein